MEEMKLNKIKLPGYAIGSVLKTKEVGYREDGKKEMTAMDHLETQSEGGMS
jgi:hypothetical protein